MFTMDARRRDTAPALRTPDQVRQRLFAFLARDDGSIAEILTLTEFSALKLGYWMACQLDHDDITVRIEIALDRIDFADGVKCAGEIVL